MAEGGAMQGGTMVWMGHQEVAGLGADDDREQVDAVLDRQQDDHEQEDHRPR